MTHIEYRTENGLRYALVPAEDYDRMLQSLQDADDIEAVRRQQTNPEPTIPGALVNRIMDGENPIRVWRQHRGMTLVALAKQVGLSRGYLHQLEAGSRQMSVPVLVKLAEALGTDLDFLVWDVTG